MSQRDDSHESIDLTTYGWSDQFAGHLTADETGAAARVIAEHREAYRLQTTGGECWGRISGRLRHEAAGRADLPAVGDWVVIRRVSAEEDAVIARVLPRRSCFSRKVAGDTTQQQIVAANIDVVWIVNALDGDLSLRRIERYLTLAYESGAAPVLVLNKADLCANVAECEAAVRSVSPGIAVHVTSALTGAGVDELRRYLRDHATIALLGSSGVGKSTLINALAGADVQRTGDVRAFDGKGRHTTTHRQLLVMPGGGLIVDTPGMRELQLWDADSGISDTFGDIEQYAAQCRFADCRHESEPGCAVLRAVADGRLEQARLESYHKLQRELQFLDTKQDKRAQAEQNRRWRSMHKALRDHPKYKRR